MEIHPHPVKTVDHLGCMPMYRVYIYTFHCIFGFCGAKERFGSENYPHLCSPGTAAGSGGVDKSARMWKNIALFHIDFPIVFACIMGQIVLFHIIHDTNTTPSTFK